MSDLVSGKPRPSAWRGILGVWRPCLPRLGAGAVLSLAALAAGLELMRMSGLRVAGMAVGVWAVTSLGLRLVGGGRVAGRYFERLFTHDAMFRALADLRVWFYRRLAAGSAAGLGFRRSGDLLSRLVSDVETLDGVYLRVFVPACGAALALALLVRTVWGLGAGLTAVLGLLFIVAGLVMPLVALRAGRAGRGAISLAQSDMRNALVDLSSGLREVRAFGAEERMRAQIDRLERQLATAQRALAVRMAVASGASYLAAQVASLAVLAAIGGAGFVRVNPVGGCALLFMAIAAFETVSGLTRAGLLVANMDAAARRIVDVADGAADDTGAGLAVPSGFDLRLEGVSFRWAPDRAQVLDGLSCVIPAGARVAVLGPSGVGKSSLAALLLKVVAPQAGRILIGGQDIAQTDTAALRTRMAWLSQATHLFDDTLRANLTLGRTDLSDEALWRALDQAALGGFARDLPDGLDTWLGEGGARISGGQGRRVALARMLLSDAPILILDEPATGLDAQTEQDFLSTLNGVADGRTVILIAHRLMGVEQLDHIWRLEDGALVDAAA